MRISRREFGAVSISLAATGIARAQSLSSQTIKIIVPYPPGGGTDVLARLIAAKLSDKLGQGVIVENRPGASGNIAQYAVSNASPNGQTLLLGANLVVLNHVLDPSPNAPNPLEVLAPVTLYAAAPLLVLASPGLPVGSLSGLVSLAKSNPGKLNYASSGSGSINHLAGALLCNVAGIELAHIPYKGVAPAMIDVSAGRVEIFISSAFSSMPQIRSGQVKVLAVAGDKRLTSLPDVPTAAEQGFGDYKIESWWGMFAPRATSVETVGALHKAIASGLASPEIRTVLEGQDAISIGAPPDAFAEFLKNEIARWTKVVREAGLEKG